MADRGPLIAVEGGSASGKTTLVEVAAHTFGWRPLPEAFDRLDPAPSLEFGSSRDLLRLEATLLAEEGRRYREARRLCERGATVVADTGFLGPLTYTRGLVDLGQAPASVGRFLERNARSLLRKGWLGIPDVTVYLLTTASERARRAQAAAPRHPTSLLPRHEAVGAIERRYFETVFPTVLPERFRTLRAGASPAVLARRLGRLVKAADATAASPAEGLALVALLCLPARSGRRPRVGPNR